MTRNTLYGDKYRSGDHLVIDDRTGFTRYASDTEKEWNGLRVGRDVFEERHPQDFVRGRTDKQGVRDSRPTGPATFIGPLTTSISAAAAAGTRSLSVATSERFFAGDRVWVMLANGDRFQTIVQAVPSGGVTLILADDLPWSVDIGAAVVNVTANAEANIG